MKFVRYPEFGIPIPAEYEIHGIDVSRYQQTISWDMVKEMDVHGIKLRFAFLKATEGIGNVDPYFNRNWKRAKEAGIIRGAYHFFLFFKGIPLMTATPQSIKLYFPFAALLWHLPEEEE